MSEAEGYPTEWFVAKLSQDFVCGICLNVMKNPHQCKNGHTNCFECFSKALKSRKLCPSCNIPLSVEGLSKSLLVRNMIDKLVVKCSNQTCEWNGLLEDRANHIIKCSPNVVDCPLYSLHLCSDPKCSGKVRANDLNRHLHGSSRDMTSEIIQNLTSQIDGLKKELCLMRDGICFEEHAIHYTLDSGGTYFGTVENNKFHGIGLMKFDAQNVYCGDFKHGKRDGYGANYAGEEVYRGQFKENKMVGHGLLQKLAVTKNNASAQPENKMIHYNGEWKDGSMSGLGKTLISDLYVHTGTYQDNAFQGEGILLQADGVTLQANFEAGQVAGDVKLLSASTDQADVSSQHMNLKHEYQSQPSPPPKAEIPQGHSQLPPINNSSRHNSTTQSTLPQGLQTLQAHPGQQRGTVPVAQPMPAVQQQQQQQTVRTGGIGLQPNSNTNRR